MLKLRPFCENCGVDLPPDSQDAMICSYECTFCKSCSEGVLCNVCPNCGGGFCPRPVRPQRVYRPGTSLVHHPATTRRLVRPVDVREHAVFSQDLKLVDPYQR